MVTGTHALFGLGGTSPADVVDPTKFTALLMPQLSWPLFDGGSGRAALHQAEAEADAARAQYRQKVLAALQDAEDSLARFGATRGQLVAQARAAAGAAEVARLDRSRYAAGTATLTDQIDSERQELAAQIAVAQAQAQLTIDYVAVNKALGLGWEDGPPVAPQ